MARVPGMLYLTNWSFFERISTNYGDEHATTMKNIAKCYKKIANQKNRRIFLIRCKGTNTYPRFLDFKIDHIQFTGTYLEQKFTDLMVNTKNKIISLLITDCTKALKKLDSELSGLKCEISRHLPKHIVDEFLETQEHRYEKLFIKIRNKNQNKFSKLLSATSNTVVDSNEWLNNISDTAIPDDVAEVLALGEKFALPIIQETNIPTTEYIASIESIIKNKPDDTKDNIRSNIVNVITNHKIITRHNKIKINNFQKNITKQLKKTNEFIKSNSQITILRPDKSNKTVIMNTTDYEQKMYDIINDSNTYKKLRYDPTKSYQNKNNNLIKKLVEQNILSESEGKALVIHNAVSPKIYGLPKLHKPNNPLRPIVSCINSPYYKLSKYLSQCLSKITGKNDYYVKDSFSFKHFIDTQNIPKDYKIISLDVISLYTNIPNDLLLKVIDKKWNDIKDHTKLPKKTFIEALKLTQKCNYFQFHDNFYEQLDGCAMGSPISSTVAQLVMEYLEENVLSSININIIFFKRYVDDCLTAIPSNKIDELLSAFNNFHPKLKFTTETEQNNEIHFLDLTIVRDSNTNALKTKWYTKPTSSSRYLNYNSQHPKAQRNSVMIGIVDRALLLTSPEFRPPILNKVREILSKNHYPLQTINKIVKQRTFLLYNKAHKTDSNSKNKTKNTTYVALPYVHRLSEKLSHILRNHDITVCHKSFNNLSKLYTPLKSKVPTKKKSNIIYEIPCLNCNQKYIGMTTQYLENRINGHKYTKNASTALHKHEKNNNHNFDFKNTKILDSDSNYSKLTVKEMIAIKKETNAVNDKQDIQNLSRMYHNLIYT